MESRPGTYILLARCVSKHIIRIGKIGTLRTQTGYYAYVGSAFGPGGVRARLAHHTRVSHRRHWHMDYLRPVVQIEAAWCSFDPKQQEHQWAELCSRLPNSHAPLNGFGSSDCKCDTHLFFFSDAPSFELFRNLLSQATAGKINQIGRIPQPAS
ncbi:MAG: GIY-YIG nuclease family protein [Gammaproteobacteria bacterium]|nr:GIY-YIG nuclease family protein [Gammaproteobacteria bacterium]